MKCSIAMTTYNGARFLPELLDSILAQTHAVDEVVICDDRSQDATIETIESFIEKHALNSWHVYVNETNIGWKKNFRRAISLCSGDIVFTCDQDDIWIPSKIEECMQAFAEHDDMLLLVSNLQGIDVSGKNVIVPLQGVGKDDGALVKKSLESDGLQHHRPGCVFCFKKSLYETMSLDDIEEFPHDSMLWKTAILLDGAYLLNRKLIYYRMHNDSADAGKKNSLADRIEHVRNDIIVDNWAIDFCKSRPECTHFEELLEKTLSFSKDRLALLENRKFWKSFGFQIKNRSLYPTWLAPIQDLLYIAKG